MRKAAFAVGVPAMRYPVETVRALKSTLSARVHLRRFASLSERRFRDDPRYDLESVTDGFRSRIDDTTDDSEVLERICAAYNRSVEARQNAPRAYEASERWQRIRERSLGPVLQALRERDIPRLAQMYRNFYRDPCSAGILGAPNGLSKAYFAGKISNLHRRFYLGHVLYRLDYWRSITNGTFTVKDLAGPGIGNPFGAVIERTHVSVGAEYAHYCSRRVSEQLVSGPATVVEIGGGFGGIAYYLLRDRPEVRHIDFDLPETIALASYYLMKAFPGRRFLCYGEQELTRASMDQADVVMLPRFALAALPRASVDLVFSSHGISDLSIAGMNQFVEDTSRITPDRLFMITTRKAAEAWSEVQKTRPFPFQLVETRESGWFRYGVSGAGVGGATGRADSTVVEQCYTHLPGAAT